MTKTKKLLSVILSLIMLLSVTAGVNMTAFAEPSCSAFGDFGYYIDTDGNAVIASYVGPETTTMIIPKKIDGHPVTHFYDFFGHNSRIRKVKNLVLPDTFKYFGPCSVCDFNSLTDIYYEGSASDWKKVGKVTGYGIDQPNEFILSRTLHFNYKLIKTVTLSATSYTYNGKVRKPTVTVKDSEGNKIGSSHYTVTYSKGRKNVGTYTVSIKSKDNYSGTIKKTFTIKPKATSISKVTAGRKAFTVKWKKQTTQTTGYQIQYSTSSKFTAKTTKTVTVSKNKTTSKKISKLKAKKKYYVRVRTYKTVKVNGKNTKIYSGWSKVKTVKTK